jgi:hypothetical protein
VRYSKANLRLSMRKLNDRGNLMNCLRKTVVLCGLSLFAAGISNAQFGMRQPEMPRGLFNPVVGSGAVYEMQLASGNKTTMEIDVVGKDSVDGKNGYWFETTMTGPQRDLQAGC